jgi:GPH family glycoside/pentoside/hexuronide:cation symporter
VPEPTRRSDAAAGAPVPVRPVQIAAYAAPGLALAIPTIPVAVLLPSYYAEDLGLGFAATGAALAAARTLDFLADPLAGALSDRLRTRGGRRKPVIAAGAVLGGCALWAVTHPPSGAGAAYLFVWALLLFIGWSLVAVPHAAWAADFTARPALRVRLVGAREAAMLLGMCLAVAAPVLADGFGLPGLTGPAGLAAVAIALGVPGFLALLLLMPQPPPAGAAPDFGFAALRDLLRNGEFSRLLLAWFVNGCANGLPAVLFPVIVGAYFGLDDGALARLMLLYFGCAVLAMPAWPALARRWGKTRVWRAAMLATCAVFACMPALGADSHTAYAAICAGTGLLLGADLVLPPALQTDVVERDVARSGLARGALFFGVWSMATKAALAVAVGVAFLGLDAAGHAAGEPLGARARWALLALYAGLPVLLKVWAVALLRGSVDGEAAPDPAHQRADQR